MVALHSVDPIVKRLDFAVEMRAVSPSIIPDTLNLALKALKPTRLVAHTIPECPHNLSEGIHLGSQVIESHV